MIRLIVALVLVNTYSGSWGAPTQNIITISSSLTILANRCANTFLSTQIQKSIKTCDFTFSLSMSNEKQFECLLFYDINSQLCDAVAASKLKLTDDYTAQIMQEQDVSQLCNAAKGWSFLDIGENYKKLTDLVFQDPVKCSKMCSLYKDDFLNVNSTFYCKYFKWGSDLLNNHPIMSTVQNTSHIEVAVQPSIIDINKSVNNESTIDKSIEDKTSINNPSTGKLKVATDNQHVLDNVESAQSAGSETTLQDKQESKTQRDETDNKIETIAAVEKTQETKEEAKNIKLNPADNGDKLDETSSKQEGVNKNSAEKPKEPVKDVINQLERNANVGDNNYQDTDLDSDEPRDGMQNQDDIDDPIMPELESKPVHNEIKKIKHPEVIYSNEIVPKEMFPASDISPEDDDHFFPFFLTAIIMVILLYILYHNKNKVTKVVLGLIVEGRQPGRRRNSRGHAYRRLDTLEQAMSPNTSAPPSKIIY